MLFNSLTFFVFFAIVVSIYWLIPNRYRSVLLLVGSYIFYGCWSWYFLALLIYSSLVDYYACLAMYNSTEDKVKKRYLMVSLLNNLGILFLFKYYNFFAESLIALAGTFGYELSFTTLHIVLPVGISFYTFQTLSYTIDIYKGRLKPAKDLLHFCLFVSYFPQLVAGPITRARDLIPQIEKDNRTVTKNDLMEGLSLAALGFVKKVLISDNIGGIVDAHFKDIQNLDGGSALVGLVAFSIQIYFDFSGYSDIARGVSRFFGVELAINFEQPYFSRNVTEFWRRWHISLSTWLRDYLYIPFGGNQKGKVRTYINLMLTMLIGGLWHGASWNFVIWGGLHGLYLAIHKLISPNKKPEDPIEEKKSVGNSIKIVLSVLLTYVLVLIAWLPFRSPDIHTTIVFAEKLSTLWQGINMEQFAFILFLFLLVIIVDFPSYYYKTHYVLKMLPKWLFVPVVVFIFVAVFISLALNYNVERPFIYFQF